MQLHYVPSPLNPADPVSRWFSGQSANKIVVQARGQGGSVFELRAHCTVG